MWELANAERRLQLQGDWQFVAILQTRRLPYSELQRQRHCSRLTAVTVMVLSGRESRRDQNLAT